MKTSALFINIYQSVELISYWTLRPVFGCYTINLSARAGPYWPRLLIHSPVGKGRPILTSVAIHSPVGKDRPILTSVGLQEVWRSTGTETGRRKSQRHQFQLVCNLAPPEIRRPHITDCVWRTISPSTWNHGSSNLMRTAKGATQCGLTKVKVSRQSTSNNGLHIKTKSMFNTAQISDIILVI